MLPLAAENNPEPPAEEVVRPSCEEDEVKKDKNTASSSFADRVVVFGVLVGFMLF